MNQRHLATNGSIEPLDQRPRNGQRKVRAEGSDAQLVADQRVVVRGHPDRGRRGSSKESDLGQYGSFVVLEGGQAMHVALDVVGSTAAALEGGEVVRDGVVGADRARAHGRPAPGRPYGWVASNGAEEAGGVDPAVVGQVQRLDRGSRVRLDPIGVQLDEACAAGAVGGSRNGITQAKERPSADPIQAWLRVRAGGP